MTRILIALVLVLGLAGSASAQLRYTVPQNCPNGKCPLQAAPAPAAKSAPGVQTAPATSGCANGSCSAAAVTKGGLFSRIRERRNR